MPKEPKLKTPLEPEGAFRWLHDRSSVRRRPSLRGITDAAGIDHTSVNALLPDNVWAIGALADAKLLEPHWDTLTPIQRGQAVAGLSEDGFSGPWIADHIGSCRFDAVSAAQTGCNAVLHRMAGLLTDVLSRSHDLEGSVARFSTCALRSGRFEEVTGQLSTRAIDLILEAALIARDTAAARLSLEHGADPNIPVWCLERSFSERHCALSHAIDTGANGIAGALIAAGANIQGTTFCTPNLPLFFAVSKGNRALAEALLEQGATFASSDPGGHRAKAIKRLRKAKPEWIQPCRDYFFGFGLEEVERVQVEVGKLVALVPIEQKQCFYDGHGQGGIWRTFLQACENDVESIEFFETHGLDTRLAAEELLSLGRSGHEEVLAYLLKKQKTTAPLEGEALLSAVLAALKEARQND
jgi:hypothetical protein